MWLTGDPSNRNPVSEANECARTSHGQSTEGASRNVVELHMTIAPAHADSPCPCRLPLPGVLGVAHRGPVQLKPGEHRQGSFFGIYLDTWYLIDTFL